MHCKGSTGYHYGLMLSRHIVPALGELPVAEVERKHIVALQYGLSDKPRWRTVRWTSWYICSNWPMRGCGVLRARTLADSCDGTRSRNTTSGS